MSATKPAIVAPPWSYAYTIIAIQTAHSAPLKKNRAIACRRRSGLRKTTVTALRIWRMCLFTGEVPATSISCSQVRMQRRVVRNTEPMAADRDAQLLALVRELERQDVDVAARIDTVAGVARSRGCGARAGRRVLDALEALPEAVAVAEQSVRDALAREEEARGEREAAERRLEEISGGRRASDEAKTEAVRAVRRATVAASDAADTVARMRERVAALASDEVALTAEADGLAVEARQVAGEVAEVPRLSDSGRSAPGTSLAEIDEWGARAHAALFVVRGGLESEREKVVLEAMPWRQRRSVSRRPAPASRSCGAGSRSRWRRGSAPALGEARVVRPQVERAAVAAAFGEAVVEPLDAFVREILIALGSHQVPAPCRRRGRAAGRARRPPGGRSTPSRPRCVRRAGGWPRGRAP